MNFPIYTASLRYRNPRFLTGGIFMSVMAGLGFYFSYFPEGKLDFDTKTIKLEFLVAAMFLIMFVAGAYLIVSYICKKETVLLINEEGVRYGRQFIPWQRIKRINSISHVPEGFDPDQSQNILSLQELGALKASLLETDHELTPTEYEQLLQSIRKHVSPQFPDLIVG